MDMERVKAYAQELVTHDRAGYLIESHGDHGRITYEVSDTDPTLKD